MNQLGNNRAFLLQQDAIESNPYEFYIATPTGALQRILQSNGTNPKVRRLSERARQDYIGITEQLPQYSVRIVYDKNIEHLLTLNNRFFIAFEAGNPRQFKAVSIKESQQIGLYWSIMLSALG